MDINKAKDKIQEIHEALKLSSPQAIELIGPKISELQALLLDAGFSKEQEIELLAFMKNSNMISLFQTTCETLETSLEMKFARYIIQDSQNPIKDFKNYPFYERFTTLLKNEIELGRIGNTDRVLFIGSGPIPITAILIHQMTHAKVDCIDRDSDSIILSQKVIDRLGYSSAIKVLHKEGARIDSANYSVIVLALLAKPKKAVLDNLMSKASSGTRIICRTSDLTREAFYEKTPERLLNLYNPIKKVLPTNGQTVSSVLLIKN